MNDPVAVILVIGVTGLLTGLLALLFWAGNRLDGLLSRWFKAWRSQAPAETQPGQAPAKPERARPEQGWVLKNAAAWALCESGRFDDLGLVKVPAGEFLMGSLETEWKNEVGGVAERPQHTLHLPAFYIGRHPVTVKEFSEFLAASGHPIEDRDRFHKLNHHADHPVVVRWADARAYTQWHGMDLPSEAEWEKAARGTDGRLYPWGNEWQAGHANVLKGWLGRRKATTTPVGAFSPQGDSPYGCSDMAGNVWEWTRSSVGSYPYDPADGREELGAVVFRIARGGAANEGSKYARCAIRTFDDWRTPLKLTGFRVVLIPFSSDL